jgi:hypothetical protein
MAFENRHASVKWWIAIVTDVQFWIPVVVLAAGLVVLRWIS